MLCDVYVSKKMTHFACFKVFNDYKSVAITFDRQHSDTSTIKHMYILSPHLRYVPTLPENTLTTGSYADFLSQCAHRSLQLSSAAC